MKWLSTAILLGVLHHSTGRECKLSKQGVQNGEATMFQREWVTGISGACGFEQPNSNHAKGFFTAAGGGDWANGLGCGACVKLSYKGRTVIVNVVDRCVGCPTGTFDLGGPAWDALTGEPPGRARGVSSEWIECPDNLAGGSNKALSIHFKSGSQAWDARMFPIHLRVPVQRMEIRQAGSNWVNMPKCENFYHCNKASSGGLTLNKGGFDVRVISEAGTFNVVINQKIESVAGKSVRGQGNAGFKAGCKRTSNPPPRPSGGNTGSGNRPGGNVGCQRKDQGSCCSNRDCPSSDPVCSENGYCQCKDYKPGGSGCKGSGGGGSTSGGEACPLKRNLNCKVDAGTFPDPKDCRGFVQCAQSTAFRKKCGPGQFFDPGVCNCNTGKIDCQGRPAGGGGSGRGRRGKGRRQGRSFFKRKHKKRN